MRGLVRVCLCLLSLVSASSAASLRQAPPAIPMAFHRPPSSSSSSSAAAAAATAAAAAARDAAAAGANPTAAAAAPAAAGGESPLRRAAMFPGQGAQCLGMGIASARAHPPSMALFRRASEILNEDLLKLCEEGPLSQLNKTNKAQPALLTASMAAYTRWKDTSDEASTPFDVCCGLSLGEFSALCFSGVLSFDDAVSLTAKRGALMQAAAEETPGCMFAVLGLNQEETEGLCGTVSSSDPTVYCGIANYLCKGNYAVSVSAAAAAQLQAAAAAAKAKRCVQLQVAGAFHSPLMKSAAEGLAKALETTTFSKPQLTSPTQWQGSMEHLVSRGLTEAFEFGPGGVLTGIMKKMGPSVKMTRVE
ncbi:hypothetical protein ACSSS7_003471 [Eimeria intestinalis]